MSQDNTQASKPPSALKRMFSLLVYVSGIGLLLFILFTIIFSLWSIFTTA